MDILRSARGLYVPYASDIDYEGARMWKASIAGVRDKEIFQDPSNKERPSYEGFALDFIRQSDCAYMYGKRQTAEHVALARDILGPKLRHDGAFWPPFYDGPRYFTIGSAPAVLVRPEDTDAAVAFITNWGVDFTDRKPLPPGTSPKVVSALVFVPVIYQGRMGSENLHLVTFGMLTHIRRITAWSFDSVKRAGSEVVQEARDNDRTFFDRNRQYIDAEEIGRRGVGSLTHVSGWLDGDSPDIAIKREIQEELGIDFSRMRYRVVQPSYDGFSLQYVYVFQSIHTSSLLDPSTPEEMYEYGEYPYEFSQYFGVRWHRSIACIPFVADQPKVFAEPPTEFTAGTHIHHVVTPLFKRTLDFMRQVEFFADMYGRLEDHDRITEPSWVAPSSFYTVD